MSRSRNAAPFLRLVAGTDIVVRGGTGEPAVGEPPADFNARERVEWHRVVAAMSAHGPLVEDDRLVISCIVRAAVRLSVLGEQMCLTGSFGRIGPVAEFVRRELERSLCDLASKLKMRVTSTQDQAPALQ